MNSANTASTVDGTWTPPAILRGTARGLEIVVAAAAAPEAIAAAVATRLAEAPAFFRGSDVRVRVEDGPLPAGSLALLEDLARTFELRIVEIAAADRAVPRVTSVWAAGTAPASQPSLPLGELPPIPPLPPVPPVPQGPAPSPPEPAPEPTADQLELALRALEPEIELVEGEVEAEREPETRVVVGPVRSGVILEHRGHLIVFGDVNPGADVRAEGNIVVLGRLRGTAHAGIGREAGFILALRLQPQQLRIGRTVARASDSDRPGSDPELAHVVNGSIIVERYLGRLPAGLAATIVRT